MSHEKELFTKLAMFRRSLSCENLAYIVCGQTPIMKSNNIHAKSSISKLLVERNVLIRTLVQIICISLAHSSLTGVFRLVFRIFYRFFFHYGNQLF